MAVSNRFLVVKEKDSKEIKYFDYDKLDGYNLKAKKDLHFLDGIDVNRIIIINPSFIEKIATKKINAKFDKLINMVQVVIDVGDEDESGEGYKIALDEAEKLKRELWNKYKKYVAEEKLELMTKKIEILEDELRLRLNTLLNSLYEQENLNKGHSR